MYSSFDFTHSTRIDIPEINLLDQDVEFKIEMDGDFGDYHIDEVSIVNWCSDTNAYQAVPLADTGAVTVDAIINRFRGDPAAEEIMFEMADRHLNGRY